jgi:hypothetical protein
MRLTRPRAGEWRSGLGSRRFRRPATPRNQSTRGNQNPHGRGAFVRVGDPGLEPGTSSLSGSPGRSSGRLAAAGAEVWRCPRDVPFFVPALASSGRAVGGAHGLSLTRSGRYSSDVSAGMRSRGLRQSIRVETSSYEKLIGIAASRASATAQPNVGHAWRPVRAPRVTRRTATTAQKVTAARTAKSTGPLVNSHQPVSGSSAVSLMRPAKAARQALTATHGANRIAVGNQTRATGQSAAIRRSGVVRLLGLVLARSARVPDADGCAGTAQLAR